MNAKKLLEEYILKHPEYWEYENEWKEVQRLKDLCQEETNAGLNISE